MWSGQVRWWNVMFGVLLLATGVIVQFAGYPSRSVLLLVLGLAALGVTYAVFGVRALRRATTGAAATYLSLAWLVFFLMLLIDTQGVAWIVCFGLFPQTWAMLPRWPALVVVTVISAGFIVVRLWSQDFAADAVAGVVISTVVTYAVSVVLGLFIDRIITEAGSRAAVIDELHRTQAQLATAEHDRGVQGERERLSREIHDTLAQGFTSVLALSRAIDAALVRGDVETARDRLALVERTAADNLSEARLIVAELTPGHLQSRTLAEALGRLVHAVSTESGVDARLTVAGDPAPLGGNTEVVILRTAQEALSNVRRHANARTARLELSYAVPDAVRLEVCDDGGGFDLDSVRTGFGLDGVRARAAHVGGYADVHSVPGQGTTVRLEVPR